MSELALRERMARRSGRGLRLPGFAEAEPSRFTFAGIPVGFDDHPEGEVTRRGGLGRCAGSRAPRGLPCGTGWPSKTRSSRRDVKSSMRQVYGCGRAPGRLCRLSASACALVKVTTRTERRLCAMLSFSSRFPFRRGRRTLGPRRKISQQDLTKPSPVRFWRTTCAKGGRRQVVR
jgi:hypothetical protein